MENSKPEVNAALGRALDPDWVFPGAPDAEAELPCISYLELNNVPASSADDEEYSTQEIYAVDIWGEAGPEEISAIAQDADREMKGIGFERTHCADVPEGDGTEHKNMIYERVK